MIADHPWFGTGLGTFVWSFPAYRSDVSMWGVWEFAHSTSLELAADLGLPLTGLIGLAWLVVLVVLIRGVRTRRNDRIVPAGALAVVILSLAHSSIDFSLQNPGYAIVVFALVGAGLAQSFSSNNVNKTHVSPMQNLAPPGLGCALLPFDDNGMGWRAHGAKKYPGHRALHSPGSQFCYHSGLHRGCMGNCRNPSFLARLLN